MSEKTYHESCLLAFFAAIGAGFGKLVTNNIAWAWHLITHLSSVESEQQKVNDAYKKVPYTQRIFGGKEYNDYRKKKDSFEKYKNECKEPPEFKLKFN